MLTVIGRSFAVVCLKVFVHSMVLRCFGLGSWCFLFCFVFFFFFFLGGGVLCIKTDLVPIFFINRANHSPDIFQQCYAFSTAPYMQLYVVFHCT